MTPSSLQQCFLTLLGIGWLLSAPAQAQVQAQTQIQTQVEAEDATGQFIQLPRPARRILSLAPHTTELLFAAGAGDQVVGRVRYSDYPPKALAIPIVGDALHLDMEAILGLRPDLVVAWGSGNGQALLRQLTRLGLPLFISEPRRLEDIARDIEALGTLSGHAAEAQRSAAGFLQRRERLAQSYRHSPRRRVFYQLWDQPLITLGGTHLISQLLNLCGGDNLFAGLSALAPAVGLEAVLAANPEVIIKGGADGTDWRKRWRRWPGLAAVQRDALVEVNPDLMQRSGPRILEGAEMLCAQLHSTPGQTLGSKGPAAGNKIPDSDLIHLRAP